VEPEYLKKRPRKKGGRKQSPARKTVQIPAKLHERLRVLAFNKKRQTVGPYVVAVLERHVKATKK